MNRLRELREEKDISLYHLSNDLQTKYSFKVGKASLNNYEREIQIPKPDTRAILADYFGVPVPYIMSISTDLSENEIVISKQEYERLKAIEAKFNQVRDLIN